MNEPNENDCVGTPNDLICDGPDSELELIPSRTEVNWSRVDGLLDELTSAIGTHGDLELAAELLEQLDAALVAVRPSNTPG